MSKPAARCSQVNKILLPAGQETAIIIQTPVVVEEYTHFPGEGQKKGQLFRMYRAKSRAVCGIFRP